MLIFGWNLQAIIGMFFQDGLTGSAWGDWSLYTTSPLRAGREPRIARNFFGGDSTSYASFDPAKELGVQDPIGFWDPLGLSADKDEATFKRRRAVEIKHGRIVRVLVFWQVHSRDVKKEGNRKHFPRRGAVQSRSFRQGGARPFQCVSNFSHVTQICLRPCMQPLVTSFRNTTSSQDTFRHLLGLSLPMCQMALQRCPSQVLTCKPRTRRTRWVSI